MRRFGSMKRPTTPAGPDVFMRIGMQIPVLAWGHPESFVEGNSQMARP